LESKDFTLPPLPKVASQLLLLTTDPDAQLSQLTSLIQQDPILTAKIFNTANSAGFGASRHIESVEQAVAWLGLNAVAGAAFALSFQSNVFNDRGYEHDVKALWAHAIATGLYAKALARIIEQNKETAFLCGLLHSIGKPFVIHTVNEYRGSSAPLLPWAVMAALMEQSYIEVGRQLANAWNFPDAIKEAINLHHVHSYHLATCPSKGALLTCLARHLATKHLDSVALSQEDLVALPVTSALKIPLHAIDDIVEMKDSIQNQIDSLVI
jgi:putative nucleotidyltransferase with HDIG domain